MKIGNLSKKNKKKLNLFKLCLDSHKPMQNSFYTLKNINKKGNKKSDFSIPRFKEDIFM